MCNPHPIAPPAHDSLNRLLHRLPADSEALWTEAQPAVKADQGILVIDDSTLDKPYANRWSWSPATGQANTSKLCQGLIAITLMWTDGDSQIPCDYRLYNHQDDNLTKNDSLSIDCYRSSKGVYPRVPSWYSSFENLKTIRSVFSGIELSTKGN